LSAYYNVYVKGQGEVIGYLDEWAEVLPYKKEDDTTQAALKRQNALATIVSQIRRGIGSEERLVVVEKNGQGVFIKDIKERKITRRKNISPKEKKTIIDMKTRGFSLSQIASILAISRNTIKSHLGRSQTS